MCFDKVLEFNPTNSDTWYSRARTKVRKGDIDNGLADLEKAIQLDRIFIELEDEDFKVVEEDFLIQIGVNWEGNLQFII